MDEAVIVYDVDGKQIYPKPNLITQGLQAASEKIKAISVSDIATLVSQIPSWTQAISDAVSAVKNAIPTETVQIVFTEHTKELLRAGAEFGKSKYGDMAANLFKYAADGTKELVGQVSFDEIRNLELPSDISNSISQLSGSISQLMLQQQSAAVLAALEGIHANTERILRGQQSDRLKLCDAAERQFLEASTIHDESLRKPMLANALQDANKARSQLFGVLEDEIKYLKEFKPGFSKNYEKDIRPKIETVRESVLGSYRAAKICAALYASLEEYETMRHTISAYERDFTSLLTGEVIDKLHSVDDGEPDKECGFFWLNEPQRISNEIKQITTHSLAIELPAALLLKGENEHG